MKTIQIKYKTKEQREWLCDINFIGEEIDKVVEDLFYEECTFFKPRIEEILTKRYGKVIDWEIVKWYN